MNQLAKIRAAESSTFRARFTTAEFQRITEAGAFEDWKIELVDGELERTQQPKNHHAMRQARLVIRLAQVVGEALARGEVGIDLGHDTMVACDAAVLRAKLDVNRWLVPSDLLLVAEIAGTTLDRDLGMKRLKYADGGVPEYWVIDGQRSVVHVFHDPRNGDYKELTVVRFSEPLPVPGTDATIVID